MSEVFPQLFLGNESVHSKEIIDKLGITHVVHITGKSEGSDSLGLFADLASSTFGGGVGSSGAGAGEEGTTATQQAVEGWQGQYMGYRLRDLPSQDLAAAIDSTTTFINSALDSSSSRVLVFSQEGVSRAPAVVLAFLLLKKNLTLRDAFVTVHSKYKTCSPNNGFMRQLMDIEKSQQGSCSVDAAFFKDDWGFGVLELLMWLSDQKTEEQKQEDRHTLAAGELRKGQLTALEMISAQFDQLRATNRKNLKMGGGVYDSSAPADLK
mmetsp:Transcript_15876/g.31106  ORF Transcript_15876/g.31106 Transcript_15876/m.31106 type:complete len:266 (+) Transcript_15876:93-890(+)